LTGGGEWPPVVAAVAVFFAGCLYFNRPLPGQPVREAAES
jgi:hypothetical protein